MTSGDYIRQVRRRLGRIIETQDLPDNMIVEQLNIERTNAFNEILKANASMYITSTTFNVAAGTDVQVTVALNFPHRVVQLERIVDAENRTPLTPITGEGNFAHVDNGYYFKKAPLLTSFYIVFPKVSSGFQCKMTYVPAITPLTYDVTGTGTEVENDIPEFGQQLVILRTARDMFGIAAPDPADELRIINTQRSITEENIRFLNSISEFRADAPPVFVDEYWQI